MADEAQPPQQQLAPPAQPAPPALPFDPANPPVFLQQFLQVQLKEIDARLEQTRLEHFKVEHGSKYSLAALDKQSDYLQRESTNHNQRYMHGLYVAGAVAITILAFLLAVILEGHEQVALELVKIVGYGGVGGAGGYGIGRLRGGKNAASPEQNSSEDASAE